MLEVAGAQVALLDEPLDLRLRGAGGAAEGVVWRARVRDDSGRVWRASAGSPGELAAAWRPAKAGGPGLAALRSLHPVALDVRAELPDGRAGARTLTRLLVGEGVRVRRWRGEVAGTLVLPPGRDAPAAVLDARASGGGDADDDPGAVDPAELAALAGPLLASRGVAVLVLAAGDLDAATGRLADVPAVSGTPQVLAAADLPVPPGVPAVRPGDPAAWRSLLARLRPGEEGGGPAGAGSVPASP